MKWANPGSEEKGVGGGGGQAYLPKIFLVKVKLHYETYMTKLLTFF